MVHLLLDPSILLADSSVELDFSFLGGLDQLFYFPRFKVFADQVVESKGSNNDDKEYPLFMLCPRYVRLLSLLMAGLTILSLF